MKDNIDKLFSYHDQKVVKLHDIEIRQIKIQGVVEETEKTIKNGITVKIDRTHDIVTRLEPIIAHHQEFITQFETMGWWASRLALTVFFGLIVWAISKGFVPKL